MHPETARKGTGPTTPMFRPRAMNWASCVRRKLWRKIVDNGGTTVDASEGCDSSGLTGTCMAVHCEMHVLKSAASFQKRGFHGSCRSGRVARRCRRRAGSPSDDVIQRCTTPQSKVHFMTRVNSWPMWRPHRTLPRSHQTLQARLQDQDAVVRQLAEIALARGVFNR